MNTPSLKKVLFFVLVISQLLIPSVNAANHAGSIKGSFEVSDQGAATYSIPLEVPPGINGMQPNLSLNYNSQAGNGLLGMGWSLGGLSVITRCPQNLAQDGKIRGIDFSTEDRYCLDGQRLVAINGVYGADGTEYKIATATYSKIISTGIAGSGPASFKVWAKSGQVREYGVTSDSRIEAQGKTDVYVWAVNKVNDSIGNQMTFSYLEDNANGFYHIDRIDYGFISLTSSLSIRFTPELRNDATTGYISRSKVSILKRFSNIKIYSNESIIKDYRLGYLSNGITAKSKLINVNECDAISVCKTPMNLSWYNGVAGIAKTAKNTGASNSGYQYKSFAIDVNGDGRSDLAVARGGTWRFRFSTGTTLGPEINSGITNEYYQYAQPIDYDGDGRMDIIYPTGGVWKIIRYNGSTFQRLSSGASNDGYQNNLQVVDINGDGLDDLIIARTGTWHFRLNTGGGFGADVNSGISNTYYQYAQTIDYDGDGKREVIYPTGGVWKILRFNGSNLKLISSGASNDGYQNNLQIADINGDGLEDLVIARTGTWHFRLNTGGGFGADVNSGISNSYYQYAQTIDYDGDGKRDVIYPTGGYWKILRFNGSNLKLVSSGASNIGYNYRMLVGDFDGNAMSDLLVAYNNVWNIRFNNGHLPDRITSLSNGLGETTNISYLPLTDNSIYTKYTTLTYPIREIQTPMYVVSSSSKSDGVGGLYSHSYKYEGLRTHLKGRGSLGFAQRSITDDQTGITKDILYRQDYPYTGLIDSTETKLSDGVTKISETSNSWDDILNGDPAAVVSSTNRFSPQLISSDEISRELDNTFISQITRSQSYDSDGNVTQVIVNSNDGYIKVNNNTYYPKDEYNWFLGKLQTTSITNTTPTDSIGKTRSSSFEYHPTTGLLTREVIEPYDPSLELIKTYTYDVYGNKASITVSGANILSRTTTHNYDYSGLFNPLPTYSIVSTNPLGHSETKVIDARWGKVASLTGPNLLTTTWSFDTLGRKVREDRADGNWTTIDYTLCDTTTTVCSYDSPMQVTTAKSGSMPVTVYFDILGREVMTEGRGFDGSIVYKASGYNALGQIAKTSLPYFYVVNPDDINWHSYDYDILGRNTRENFPDGSSTSIDYQGLTTVITNDKGQVSKTIKNSQGKLVQSVDAALNSNFYEYDAFGYLINVTDSVGNVTSMTYNKRGHKIAMNDPDMGSWQYAYNALGKLTWQKDAKGQEASIEYDLLGRMVKRTEAEGVSEWTYDTAVNGKGKLAQVTGPDGFSQTIQYDSYSRPFDTTTVISGQNLNMQTGYDSYGRVASTTYPSGFTVSNIYNSYGFLSEVRNTASNDLYWKADTVDASGRIINHTLGNGLTSSKFFNPQTGRLEGIKTGVGLNGVEVQNLGFSFDTLGNLTSRQDGNKNLYEAFTYDELNRLNSATLEGQSSKIFTYDSIGNIQYKTDVGDYIYGQNGAGPHAVTSAGGVLYDYDSNGNQISGDGRTLTYTSFNKPKTISKGVATSTFNYGPNHKRIQQVNVNNGSTTVTRYLGKLYEVVNKPDGVVEYKHYINTAGALVLHTERSSSINDTRYIFKDHLGSTDVITNESGQVVESLSYDAFGARRNALSWTAATLPITSMTTRGFTGHEMHDDFGLVNMNARMYDPKLGRFLQADVFVQFPQSTQGFNRYTYVNNNPLSYTDPTGHFLKSLKKFVKRYGEKIVRVVAAVYTAGASEILYSKPVRKIMMKNKLARQLGSIVAAYYGGSLGSASFNAYLADISGGDPFKAFASSMAFSYIASGGKMNFKPPAAQGSMTFTKFAARSLNTQAKQRLVGNIVEKNTNLSRDEFNGLMFAISVVGTVTHDTRVNQDGIKYKTKVDNELIGFGNRGKSGLFFDVVDSILAWQGMPTGNTFVIAKNYTQGESVRSHSLATMETNNLIAAGVIHSSDVTQNALVFGTVGLGGTVNIGSMDIIAGGSFGQLFTPSANVISMSEFGHGRVSTYPN